MGLRKLIVLAVVGLLAQLVDGALGMGYGVTSTSLLLLAGLSPAAASASVHLAELGTNLASGTTHWRLGNVDKRILWTLGVPGAVGAFAGATVLSSISTEVAKPVMGTILVVLGLYILARFTIRPPRHDTTARAHGRRFLVPLGLVGGFIDATGGGGWGPVSTSTLLSAGRTAPRTVVGSVDASEFLVTLAASVGFFVALGNAGVSWPIVGALLLGGLVAAPLAAWLVSRLPATVLGVSVGGLIIATNVHTFLQAVGVGSTARLEATVVVWVGWLAVVGYAVVRHRRASGTRGVVAEPAVAAVAD